MTLDRGTSMPGIDCGDGYRQVGMSDDGLPMYRCDFCGAASVGITYVHDCEKRLLAARASLLAAGDGRSLVSADDDAYCDHIDERLAAVRARKATA